MPRVLTESQAQANFSQIIADVCNGEEIIITPNNAPTVHLMLVAKPADDKEKKRQALIAQREKAIASIRQWHKYVIGSPMTIEEIISARDEGRK